MYTGNFKYKDSIDYEVTVTPCDPGYNETGFDVEVWIHNEPIGTSFEFEIDKSYQRGNHSNDEIGYYLIRGVWEDQLPTAAQIEANFNQMNAEEQRRVMEMREVFAAIAVNRPDERRWKVKEYSDGKKYMIYASKWDKNGATTIDLDFICDIMDNVEPILRDWNYVSNDQLDEEFIDSIDEELKKMFDWSSLFTLDGSD